MTKNLVNKLRDSRNSQSALKISLLTNISVANGRKIFVFEGDEDYGMYETWITRKYGDTNNVLHICGKGKKQLMLLYQDLVDSNDQEILPNCYFFVDHDYDITVTNGNHILTLDCYSAENYAICIESISSILKDEFKLDIERQEIFDSHMKKYQQDYNKFITLARTACKPLFVNHQHGKVKHYATIEKLINIKVDNISWKDNISSLLIKYDDSSSHAATFDSLSDKLAIKGKYIFEFVKKWLCSLKKELKTLIPDIPIKKDPLHFDLRRFASIAPIPRELEDFLESIRF